MITIRPEKTMDYSAIFKINQLAFRNRTAEALLIEAVRESESFNSNLSLVAEKQGELIGHILFSEIYLQTQDEKLMALALAPMAVLPQYQRQGIGSSLVRKGLEASKEAGYKIVIVLGHPNFYPRFGFLAELALPLKCPYGDCGEAWMALELIPESLKGVRGEVVYPPAFEGV